AVRNGTVEFVPERFSKIYYNWMENIQDWCISRQLWWGHRIPAYYCTKCENTVVSYSKPTVCTECGGSDFVQDEDTLDTWFSSALWPFSTLGWPEKTDDLEYFYPTNTLVTGYDIIFFWVARMIFSGIEHMGEAPFKYVFIHGIVRDALGRKMSKSLGNGIDPLEVIDQYGTDSLRYALTTGNAPGNDLRFSTEKVEAGRNFTNKLWNASRFVLMNFEENLDFSKVDESKFAIEDKWILSRMNTIVKEVTDNMEAFEFGIALQKLYEFMWDEFCDWYIELAKPKLYDMDKDGRLEAQYVLNEVLSTSMKLLHPFMPFITEEIYQHLMTGDKSIMISKWPEYDEKYADPEAEKNMQLLMNAIKAIRNIRAEMNVPLSKRAKIILVTGEEKKAQMLKERSLFFRTLAGASDTIIQANKSGVPHDSAAAVIEGVDIYIPLEELIDIDKEIERLSNERDNLVKELARVDEKLSNENFVKKAPEKVVNEEREKKVKYQGMYESVCERINKLSSIDKTK
ncbi:MAG: class I tRNA ligase family protein, partial [Eubacteriales bacterium]|nr:class I tRNA ligase family protein [Eubacteriales bacterium]